MASRSKQWFGPAKQNNMGFGVYSYKGWLSILVLIALMVADFIVIHDILVGSIILVVMIVLFFVFAAKHGAKFGNHNLR